jgi:hypothetical protein
MKFFLNHHTNTLLRLIRFAPSRSTQDIEYDNDDSIYLRFDCAALQYEVPSEIPNRSRMSEGTVEENPVDIRSLP